MTTAFKAPSIASSDRYHIASSLLFREARFLDNQQWDEWIDLYDENAVYWIPSWDGQHKLIDDPKTGISLMYYADRSGIEDRIYRIRTGLSSASTPLPRTVHNITNIEVENTDKNQLLVRSNWQCMTYRWHETVFFAGHYEHLLKPVNDNDFLINAKKIIVKNDLISIPMDVYNV
jgi:3-phenylpropionate/cinnamic acid dioxygenase small subunit